MKKFLSLALLSFTLLQSCTQDELQEVTPDKVVTTSAGVTIENAAKGISKLVVGGAKAILLKPYDIYPDTHLTTLFYADNNGNIKPIIENFEVRQVEVTKNGVYVQTNYTEVEYGEYISFFVDYDLNWIQIKDAGTFFTTLKGGDNIIFSHGAVLDTKTLSITTTGIDFAPYLSSKNLLLLNGIENSKVVNVVTGQEQIFNIGSSADFQSMVSLNDDSMVLLEFGAGGSETDPKDLNPEGLNRQVDHKLLNMKTGEMTDVNITHDCMYRFRNTVVRNTMGNGYAYFSGSANYNGDLYYTEIEFDGNQLVVKRHAKYPFEDTHGSGVPDLAKFLGYSQPSFDLKKLVDYKISSKVIGNYVYYSGLKDGQPISGTYDFVNDKQYFVVKDIFSDIHLLMPF